MRPPDFIPLRPDFPVDVWSAASTLFRLLEGAAPGAFTSWRGLDEHAPGIGWPALRRIWGVDKAWCSQCTRRLLVRGFATAPSGHAFIARVCLICELTFVERATREALDAVVRSWGFKDAQNAFLPLVRSSGVTQSAGEAPTPDEARAQLFAAALKKEE